MEGKDNLALSEIQAPDKEASRPPEYSAADPPEYSEADYRETEYSSEGERLISWEPYGKMTLSAFNKRVWRNIIILSFAFMCNYISYGGLANLQVGRAYVYSNMEIFKYFSCCSTVLVHTIAYMDAYHYQQIMGAPVPRTWLCA